MYSEVDSVKSCMSKQNSAQKKEDDLNFFENGRRPQNNDAIKTN